MTHYSDWIDGEWVRPKRRGFREACCDCGLVHVVDHRIVKDSKGLAIEVRVSRNERATAVVRAAMRRKREGVFGGLD